MGPQKGEVRSSHKKHTPFRPSTRLFAHRQGSAAHRQGSAAHRKIDRAAYLARSVACRAGQGRATACHEARPRAMLFPPALWPLRDEREACHSRTRRPARSTHHALLEAHASTSRPCTARRRLVEAPALSDRYPSPSMKITLIAPRAPARNLLTPRGGLETAFQEK